MNTHTNTDQSTCADIGRRIAAVLYAERAAALARRAVHEVRCDDRCAHCDAAADHDCPEFGR